MVHYCYAVPMQSVLQHTVKYGCFYIVGIVAMNDVAADWPGTVGKPFIFLNET